MVVAGSVSAVLQKECSVSVFLCNTSSEITFTLFSNYVGNDTFFGFKVIAHCLSLILRTVILKHRVAYDFTGGIRRTYRIYGIGCHVKFNFSRGNLLLTVLNFAVSVKKSIIPADKEQGVGSVYVDN